MPLDFLHYDGPAPQLDLLLKGSHDEELVIDNFAGGGGASTGIERALGRPIDYAINHDEDALSVHLVNHPRTHHLCENIWSVDPRVLVAGRRVALCWLSPDCRHFSKAASGKPKEKKIRGLMWIALRYASLPAPSKPRVIVLENVPEIVTACRLDRIGRPDWRYKGENWRSFLNALRRQGYVVEHRILTACDYGSPTIRRRLFLIARSDGGEIRWPEPTHGAPNSEGVRSGRLKPWRTAAECIDFTKPTPSIFLTKEEADQVGAKRPLAEDTMKRLFQGVKRYVVEADDPFMVAIPQERRGKKGRRAGQSKPEVRRVIAANLVTCNHQDRTFRGQAATTPMKTLTAARDANGLVATEVMPLVNTYYGMKRDGEVRGQRVDGPIHAITTENRFALLSATVSPSPAQPPGTAGDAMVACHLTNFYGSNTNARQGQVTVPAPTLTSEGFHQALVAAYIAQQNTGLVGHDCRKPLSTIVGTASTQTPALG